MALFLYLFICSKHVPTFIAAKVWSPLVLLLFGARVKVRGIENLEKNEPYIIMANHTSFLDIPVLLQFLPLSLFFVAKKELKKIPFLGWFMIAAGMIFMDRSHPT